MINAQSKLPEIRNTTKPIVVIPPSQESLDLPADHWSGKKPEIRKPEAPEPLADNVKLFGKKLAERFTIGWKNMAYLTSEQCKQSQLGRIAAKVDLPLLLLGLIPFMHFLWLITPSVWLFAAGAILKKPIGHEFLPH